MSNCDQFDQKKFVVKATGWGIPNMLGSKKLKHGAFWGGDSRAHFEERDL